jgi:signal peptidase I
MRTRRARRLTVTLLWLTALALLWHYFAPVAIGGSTTYVVTDGVSMEPRFHAGDLALVRSQSTYRVGEIVAYRSRELHTIVLHRIVGRNGARYVFKGDNNNFLDFEHPARSQLVGALWLHIPGIGATLDSIRSPALIGLLAAVGTLLLAGSALARRRRRRRRRREVALRARSGHISPPRIPGSVGGALTVAAFASVPVLLFAAFAFTRPTTGSRPFTVPYRQSGTFSYSAAASSGPTYPSGQAVTGEPLFTHVIDAVELRFAYRFGASAVHSVAGTISLGATVASTNGWQSTLELAPPQRFHGDRALVSARLDLTSLLATLRRVENTTDVGGSYTLTLQPRVSTAGSVSAIPLLTTFSPRLQFSLDPLELEPVVSSAAAAAGAEGAPAAGAPPPASLFTHLASGSLSGERREPLFVSLGLIHVSVAVARWLALGAIELLCILLLAALLLLRPRPRAESEHICAKYGQLIVEVARVLQPPDIAVIDVASIDALVQLAERYERSILYERGAASEAFWVSDESGQFRYAPGADPTEATDEALERRPPRATAYEEESFTEELGLERSPSPLVDRYAQELERRGLLRRREPPPLRGGGRTQPGPQPSV